MFVAKTACNMCSTRCGINVHVADEKIAGITGMLEHPCNTLCRNVKAIPELVYSNDRLTKPLRKINGKFKELSWDEAFDFIADRLTDIKEKYGARSVIVHVGIPFVATHTQKIIRRFSDLYGTPNYTTGSSFCSLARTIAYSLTCGRHICPDYSADTRCMVLWGTNPRESFPLQADAIEAMRARGAKLIVIDPRRTSAAKEADVYAQIRPGTDTALALGILNVIINEELYDREFVKAWTVGFDKLVKYVKQYPPQRVEEITWVSEETIKSIARLYSTNRPASIALGISLDHSTNGIQASRAATTVMAITGNIDVPGGNILVPGFMQTNLRVEERVERNTAIGEGYPLFSKYTLEQTVTPVIDGALTDTPYPIKGLLAIGVNPMLTWPNTNKVEKFFEKLEFSLVTDVFMTDTAKKADVVLPGTTFLERQDLIDYRNRGFSLIFETDRAINPIGQSMEDWKIWAELGKRMGYAEYFPWKDTDELFGYLLKNANITLDEIKRHRGGVFYADKEYYKYLKGGFPTPSGKIEIYSQLMDEHGYDSIPTFAEPAESLMSLPSLRDRYPLTLITGPRIRPYFHSQYRNLPSMRRLVPEPLIEIHPLAGNKYGVADGDVVRVESLRGFVTLKAKLTEDIHPCVVSVQHGWSEANINYLTDDKSRDPISAYPGFRSVLCRVTKM